MNCLHFTDFFTKAFMAKGVALYFKFTEYSLDDACFALMSDILVAFLS
jgi:hypothetical protein